MLHSSNLMLIYALLIHTEAFLHILRSLHSYFFRSAESLRVNIAVALEVVQSVLLLIIDSIFITQKKQLFSSRYLGQCVDSEQYVLVTF